MQFTAICAAFVLALTQATPAGTPAAAHRARVVSSVATPAANPQAPKILAIQLNKTDVRGGDVVSGTVVTSLSVASVEARIGGFGIGVPKVGPGRFALTYTVPYLPFFWHRGFAFDIVARNTAGEAAHRTITINVH